MTEFTSRFSKTNLYLAHQKSVMQRLNAYGQFAETKNAHAPQKKIGAEA